MGFPIALGIALARPEITVFCVCSDGETMEGSFWESLRLMADIPITNLQLTIIENGYSAYGRIKRAELNDRILPFAQKAKQSLTVHFPDKIPFLDGIHGHYQRLDEETYLALKEIYA
jgi:thiamine pyrophosphate-dependent acetolactate synthase large subunit-like protein